MDPPELASEHAPCYARRGRIEPPPVDHVHSFVYGGDHILGT